MTEPERGGTIFFEYWNVAPENAEAWLDYYRRVIAPALHECTGVTSVQLLRRGSFWDQPRQALTPHFGSRWNGVRTDAAINFSALLQHEYTYAVITTFADGAPADFLDQWFAAIDRFDPDWRARHPDTDDRVEALSRDLFTLVVNHWDVTYDILEEL